MSKNALPVRPGPAQRHLRFGWWSLFGFAALGLTLEILHGFKVPLYLDAANETRRLMWRLAHAHGVLLALVNVVYGLALGAGATTSPHAGFISTCLISASLLVPVGFFTGGITFYSGDPGLGILLVPVGACLLLAALFYIARAFPGPAGKA